MSRYAAMFERLGDDGAFVPFCVLGDPNPEESLAIVRTLAQAGADALELGIPFSDPVADGPTIQAADVRALNAGTTPADAWKILATIRAAHPDLPLGLLVYANLVEARGRADFYRRAHESGVDSVLIADVPTIEAMPYTEAAEQNDVAPVLIAPPNASDEDLERIAQLSRGYTYVVSRRGVTGTETEAGGDLNRVLTVLARYDAPPAIVGFGISKPEHVRAALVAGARGAISGSAIVRIIAEHLDDGAARAAALTDFVRAMKDATASPG